MWLVDLCLYCLMLIRDLPLELIRELWRRSLKMPSFLFHLQGALVRLEILEFSPGSIEIELLPMKLRHYRWSQRYDVWAWFRGQCSKWYFRTVAPLQFFPDF